MTLIPLKVVYQLVVGECDDDGYLIGEHLQQAVTLYRPQFGELEARIAATMATSPTEATRTGERCAGCRKSKAPKH